jgi:hypothetical protein
MNARTEILNEVRPFRRNIERPGPHRAAPNDADELTAVLADHHF